MNKRYIFKYIISFVFLLFINLSWSQKDSLQIAEKDSLKPRLINSIRVGVDLSRPITQLIQKQDIGLEVTTDIRLKNNWYLAADFGYESEPTEEDYIHIHSKGSYTKLGFNYNAYENLKGMNNEVYVGMRYGFSSFQQELISYSALDFDNYFGEYFANPNTTFDGLTAHWAALHFGLKVETLPNLYLSVGVHFKKLLGDKKPEGFDNLYIPGFGSVLLNNNAVGFNYTISYLIPLSKKIIKQN
ncbi:MAG TPA: hypothetical protein EYG92_03910 [Lutibacter sp.]|nr:hypothetical protein [Lutibacter sp.]